MNVPEKEPTSSPMHAELGLSSGWTSPYFQNIKVLFVCMRIEHIGIHGQMAVRRIIKEVRVEGHQVKT